MPDPVFIVKFERGLADRHRLPLAHVISVLDELRQMITSVGKDLQKRHGVQNPSGDFGLELLAGRGGIVFKKGSVQAEVAITRDIPTGLLAANSVLATVQRLGRVKTPDKADLGLQDPVEQKIVRHLSKIASIQGPDKTELRLSLKRTSEQEELRPKRTTAVFGDTAVYNLRAAKLPAFATDDLTLYGRLFELKDRNRETDSNRFWGELRLDNGENWRVQFDTKAHPDVTTLFRKQVQVTGRAYYYEAYPPKIVPKADGIAVDEERDYLAAFDELYGSAKETLGSDFDTLLREMHGE